MERQKKGDGIVLKPTPGRDERGHHRGDAGDRVDNAFWLSSRTAGEDNKRALL